MNRLIICVGSLLLVSTISKGDEYYSGTKLYELCNDQTTAGLCVFYIRGFMEGMVWGSELVKARRSYCPPSNVSVTQGRLVVEKYIREHPSELNKAAGVLAGKALALAFPCPPSN